MPQVQRQRSLSPQCVPFGFGTKTVITLCAIIFLLAVNFKPGRYLLNFHLDEQNISSIHAVQYRNSSSYFKVAHYRFPSVQERLQYYMGDWYRKSGWTVSDSDCTFLSKPVDYLNAIGDDVMMSTTEIKDCMHGHNHVDGRISCADAYRMINNALDLDDADSTNNRWLFSNGDRSQGFNGALPIITKARQSSLLSNVHNPDQPIMWPLNVEDRHFGPVENYDREIVKRRKETPWSKKLPKLFWRGVTTGTRIKDLVRWINYNDNHIDIAFNEFVQGDPSGFNKEYVTRHYVSGSQTLLKMNRYKYLLSIEGNDVATGLKWMLYSNSVVFMSPPTRVSWAMEDLLVPFVHYIPLSNDYSNLLEMVEWANEHDEACQEISQRATEFIKHLWMSEQAKKDTEYLKKELVTLYVKHFDNALSKCAPETVQG